MRAIYQLWRGDIDPITKQEVFQAIRPIKAGEDITINYFGANCDYEHRQQVTKLNYGFACTCSLCTVESGSAKKDQE